MHAPCNPWTSRSSNRGVEPGADAGGLPELADGAVALFHLELAVRQRDARVRAAHFGGVEPVRAVVIELRMCRKEHVKPDGEAAKKSKALTEQGAQPLADVAPAATHLPARHDEQSVAAHDVEYLPAVLRSTRVCA